MKHIYISALKAIAIAVLYLGTGGCVGMTPDPEFIESEDFILRKDGVEVLKYDPVEWQMSFNREKKQFRVFNDRMTKFYILTCSEIPQSEGQKVKCTLKYTDIGSTPEKTGLNFKVVKTKPDGTVWLWCRELKTGVTVKILDM